MGKIKKKVSFTPTSMSIQAHTLHTCHQEPQERTKKIGVKHTETRCGTTMITKCFHHKSKNTTYG